jgi:2-polyprenyl-6-methoxyphenol hydroxylase-like FAD-dependent oxidoreductase
MDGWWFGHSVPLDAASRTYRVDEQGQGDGTMAISPTAAARAIATPRVLIAGAGPTGMSTALGLASRGVASTVVEAYPRVASRSMLLNVSPSAIDELARIGAVEAIDSLDAIRGARSVIHGKLVTSTPSSRVLVPDAARARGEMDDLLAAIRGEDVRPWGRAPIGDLENALREAAEGPAVRGLIDARYGAKVVSISQDATGVTMVSEAADGARQTHRGAYLVSATGGRNTLGIAREIGGPEMHYLGGRFPAAARTETSVLRELEGGASRTTIGLKYAGDRSRSGNPSSLVWAQVDRPAGELLESDAGRALLARRAERIGVEGALLDEPLIPVRIQLGRADRATDGRVLLVGDETMAPYFPNSTGANKGIGVDSRRAVDAIMEAIERGDHAAPFAAYDDAIRAGDEALNVYNVRSLDEALALPAAAAR